MHALRFVPINGQVTLDSHVEGQPGDTLRKRIAAKDSWIKNALGEIREAEEEKARLRSHLSIAS